MLKLTKIENNTKEAKSSLDNDKTKLEQFFKMRNINNASMKIYESVIPNVYVGGVKTVADTNTLTYIVSDYANYPFWGDPTYNWPFEGLNQVLLEIPKELRKYLRVSFIYGTPYESD